MELGGKTALVTGGTEGIGLEIARQLKAKGAHVIVAARRPERLDAARAEGFETIGADLSRAADVDALADSFAARALDLLVNNAGAGVEYDVTQPIDLDAAERTIALNLAGPIRLITRLLGPLKTSRGTIVNVTSGLAIAPRAGSPVYCATKAGLRSFTMALRAQLAPFGVRVIEALPPVVDTAMTAGRGGRKQSPAACAAEIVAGIERDAREVNAGMVKLLRLAESLSPALARRIMLRF